MLISIFSLNFLSTKSYPLQTLSERREITNELQELGLSLVRACKITKISRTVMYRQANNSNRKKDVAVIEALNVLVQEKPQWGFWKYQARLRLDGKVWNHKRTWRVYKALKLNLPRRRSKKRFVREVNPLQIPSQPNQVWSLDFMSDALWGGKRFRTLNILDDAAREALAIEVDTSLPALRVVRVLEHLKVWRGIPKTIRLDNGPECVSGVLEEWCAKHQVELKFIQPGKPNQNAFIERFNRTFRTEVLDAWAFSSLQEVRCVTSEWLRTYNDVRPHDALDGLPPSVYRARLEAKNPLHQLST